MLSIGDFARRGRVTVRALHHYDAVGLLPPAHIDPATGYRFYTESQLPRLQRIAELKALGFRLEELAALLDAPPPAEEWRRQLEANQAQLLRQLNASQSTLARVDAALRELHTPGEFHLATVELVELEPQLVAGIRARIPVGTVYRLFEQLQDWLNAQGVVAYGPFLTLGYHDGPYVRGEQEIEAAVVLATPLAGSGPVRFHELPATEAIRVMHTGDYQQLARGYELLHRWRQQHGYDSPSPWREIYWREGRHVDDPLQFVTELVHPVQPWSEGEGGDHPRLLHAHELPGLQVDYYEAMPLPSGDALRPRALPAGLTVSALDDRNWVAVEPGGQIVVFWTWAAQRRPHFLLFWQADADPPEAPAQVAEEPHPLYFIPGGPGQASCTVVVGMGGYLVVSSSQLPREQLLAVAASVPFE